MSTSAAKVDISAAVYYADYPHYMTSHKLETFRKSPALFKYEHIDCLGKRVESSAFTFGTACHCFILEGMEEFQQNYLVSDGPINSRTGKAYGRDTQKFKEWLSDNSQGRELLTVDEYEQINAMAQGVQDHAKAKELLSSGNPEVTIRGQVNSISCQSRLDWVCDRQKVICDLKTVDSLHRFERQFEAFGYNRQLAFYRNMVKEVTGEDYQVFIIVTEKAAPYRCGVWHISPDTLNPALEDVNTNLQAFGQSMAHNFWPTRYEEVRSL